MEWSDLSEDEKFSCAGAKRYDTKEDTQELVQSLAGKENLKGVSFSGNTFSVDACASLAEALRGFSKLEQVDLSDIFTTRLKTDVPPALDKFVETLQNIPIKVLDGSHNALGGPGTRSFLPLLSSPHLRVLKLTNCGLGTAGALYLTDFARKLSSAPVLEAKDAENRDLQEFLKDRTLEDLPEVNEPVEIAVVSLHLGRNRLKADGAEALALGLGYFKHLKELYVNANSIPEKGLVAILRSLRDLTDLEVLDLNDNSLKESGAQVLVEILPSFPRLRHLDVGDCSLEEDGALFVVKHLDQVSNHLEYLNLSYNELNDEGVEILIEALKNKPALKKLELNGSAIKKVALNALKKTLADAGKADALGSMSDNEGDSDDDSDAADDSDDSDLDDLTSKVKKLGISK